MKGMIRYKYPITYSRGQAGTGLPIPEGWKAELTSVVGCILKRFTCPQTVAHPSSNRARHGTAAR